MDQGRSGYETKTAVFVSVQQNTVVTFPVEV
jgi:hypothetical protein